MCPVIGSLRPADARRGILRGAPRLPAPAQGIGERRYITLIPCRVRTQHLVEEVQPPLVSCVPVLVSWVPLLVDCVPRLVSCVPLLLSARTAA